MSTVLIDEFAPLRERVSGDVAAPGDESWDAARSAWNLAADQQPAAVVIAESADDIIEAVRFARDKGYAVSGQGTGHAASALVNHLAGTILIKTHLMRGVEIDPKARIARVEAGALWMDVTVPAQEYGLAALAGSSPDVGVVGYTLGGGLSWLSRTHGVAANSVTAIEVVTADGELVRTDAVNEPGLFWALRGGGGSFAIVTAIEFALYPQPQVYAGTLFFPIERAREVLHAWRELAPSMPEAMTTVGRLLMLPPLEEIPEPVRGRSFVIVEAIYLGDEAEGSRLLEPLRRLGPEMDTTGTIPVAGLSALHMDPEHPVPGAGDGMLLTDVPAEAVDAIADLAESGAVSSLLSIELRQLGGAVARRVPSSGAVGHFDAGYAMFAVGIAPFPEAKAAVNVAVDATFAALEPWRAPSSYINFIERETDLEKVYPPTSLQRLRELKRWYDPNDIVRSNHPIRPAV